MKNPYIGEMFDEWGNMLQVVMLIHHKRHETGEELSKEEKKEIEEYQTRFYNRTKNYYSKNIKHELMEVLERLGNKKKYNWLDRDEFNTVAHKYKIAHSRMLKDLR